MLLLVVGKLYYHFPPDFAGKVHYTPLGAKEYLWSPSPQLVLKRCELSAPKGMTGEGGGGEGYQTLLAFFLRKR